MLAAARRGKTQDIMHIFCQMRRIYFGRLHSEPFSSNGSSQRTNCLSWHRTQKEEAVCLVEKRERDNDTEPG